MTLTITISKKSVSKQQEGLWNITLNLTCQENSTEVINQDFNVRYKTGQDIETKVAEIQVKMQEAIDKYKSEQQIFSHKKLDDAITALQSNLIG